MPAPDDSKASLPCNAQRVFFSTLFPREKVLPATWFDEAFPRVPYARGQQPGGKEMLVLVGYDIAHPRRLQKVAKTCEDYGLRVQYSWFECFLTDDQFDMLWHKLLDLIDEEDDRLVAYLLDATSAKNTRTAGTMVCADQVVCYLI